VTRITVFQAALFAVTLLTGPALAQGAPSGFEVTAHDANMMEIRFHNMPLKGVHADAAQNALALDFLNGVDGAAFDRLAAAMPGWISMAYANYDSGVIRAAWPVTFLTRNESDGFSLRLVANAPGPMVQAPPDTVPLRGTVDGGPPPAPDAFARSDSYGAMRP
jgi:hypothetical protein